MAKIDITLYDNTNYDFDEYKKYYMESCDIEDADEVSDESVWDYIADCQSNDWDAFQGNMKYSKYKDSPCVIVGSLGLWNGTHSIEPVTCDNIMAAVMRCFGRSVDYIRVKQVNGHVEVDAIHHDGTNSFEIHLLNDKGIHASSLGKANLGSRCYHKAIKGYIF